MARGEAPDFRGALLSAPNAKRLAERLARLRGAAMKIGQLVSMQGEDMLPAEFAHVLSGLRSQAAAMPPQQLHRVLGREYGAGWECRFAAFDPEPVAAASIGQVHRVTTADGRDLALKIQYPGVARSIASDVDNVAALLRLFNLLPIDLDVAGIADEAKRQLTQEADYLAEAGFLEHFAKLVADEPTLLVPRVHRDLTTTRIMAMDFVEAAPLDVLATMSQSRRNAVGTLFERLLFRELFEFRVMQTDPNFANYLYQPKSGRLVLLDFGATRHFGTEFVANYARISRAAVDGDRAAPSRARPFASATQQRTIRLGASRRWSTCACCCASRCAMSDATTSARRTCPLVSASSVSNWPYGNGCCDRRRPRPCSCIASSWARSCCWRVSGAQVDARSLILPFVTNSTASQSSCDRR